MLAESRCRKIANDAEEFQIQLKITHYDGHSGEFLSDPWSDCKGTVLIPLYGMPLACGPL